ncbi:EspA/EspE family type VII secretion system effector [Mycobacterium sp. 050134]|uniref:EspA/EspE family type VII secretion system effector n=1 Tax=Mycobacterium sp. 050134 TaxID=3096111 RepID=UPI002ED7E638
MAQAASVLGAIAGLGGEITGPGANQDGIAGSFGPENIAASAAGGAADLGMLASWGGPKTVYALMGTQFRQSTLSKLGKAGVQRLDQATNITSWTYTVVEMMELTTGLGPPNEGDNLEDGSAEFTKLHQLLLSAIPDNEWQGSGSDAYAQLSATLQKLAVTTAELDTKLADIVRGHAEWVNHIRLGFALLKDLLFAAIVIEITMAFTLPSPTGSILARAVAVAVAGIGAATGLIATLVSCSFDAGAKAEDLMNQYNELLYQTGQKGRLAQTSAATSTESTVADFNAISNSMPGGAGAAPSPRAARGHDTPTAYRTNTEDTALTVTQSKTTTGGAGTSSFTLPTITLPTLAQVATMSGQSARISGQLAQHVNLFNQAMGQVQQIAQMAQQNQPAPPPAPDTETVTDVNAETGEDTDAAAGSPDGQRAPVEQTAPGAPPAQRGGERIL